MWGWGVSYLPSPLRSHPHQDQSPQESPGRESYSTSTGEDQDDDKVQLPVGCVHLADLLPVVSSR